MHTNKTGNIPSYIAIPIAYMLLAAMVGPLGRKTKLSFGMG